MRRIVWSRLRSQSGESADSGMAETGGDRREMTNPIQYQSHGGQEGLVIILTCSHHSAQTHKMQPSTATSSPLTTFQPVLPALTTILTHIDAQRATQDKFQASSTDGSLTDAQETTLHAYDDKISKQVRIFNPFLTILRSCRSHF